MEKYKELLKYIIEEQNIFRIMPNLDGIEQATANKRLMEIHEIKKGYYPFEIECIYEFLKPKADDKRILELARIETEKRKEKLKVIKQMRMIQAIEYYEKHKKEMLEREEKEEKFWDFLIALIVNRQIAVMFYSMEPDVFIQALLAITKPKNNINFTMGGNYEY